MSGHPRNYRKVIILTCGALLIAFFRTGSAQGLTREQWGALDVTVSKSGSTWAIIGKKNRVTLNASDLSLKMNAGSQTWQMVRSSTSDMTVRTDGRDVDLRLADAKRIEIVPY